MIHVGTCRAACAERIEQSNLWLCPVLRKVLATYVWEMKALRRCTQASLSHPVNKYRFVYIKLIKEVSGGEELIHVVVVCHMLLSCFGCFCELLSNVQIDKCQEISNQAKTRTHTHTPWSVWQKYGDTKKVSSCPSMCHASYSLDHFLFDRGPSYGGWLRCVHRQAVQPLHEESHKWQQDFCSQNITNQVSTHASLHLTRDAVASELSASRGWKSVKSVNTSLALSFVAVSSHEDFRIIKLWPWSSQFNGSMVLFAAIGSSLNQLINHSWWSASIPYHILLTILNAYLQPVRAIE